jgi:hypothetical protein
LKKVWPEYKSTIDNNSFFVYCKFMVKGFRGYLKYYILYLTAFLIKKNIVGLGVKTLESLLSMADLCTNSETIQGFVTTNVVQR